MKGQPELSTPLSFKTLIDGRFRVNRMLGAGGMGEVYQALDERTGEHVAIKLLHQSLLMRPNIRLYFQYEYHRLLGLNHPHILSVHDYGVWNGRPYFTMEHIDGVDLHQAELDASQILEVLIQVTDALSFIHGRHFVHRDLKPANIRVVTRRGQLSATIMDFGLMVRSGANLGGRVAGTRRFMSPEAHVAQRLDHRSDLYSMGVLIYWLLAKEYPREQSSAASSSGSLSVVDWSNPILPLPTDAPPALAKLTMELLNPAPAGRPARTHDVLRRLNALGCRWRWRPNRRPPHAVTRLDRARPIVASAAAVGRR